MEANVESKIRQICLEIDSLEKNLAEKRKQFRFLIQGARQAEPKNGKMSYYTRQKLSKLQKIAWARRSPEDRMRFAETMRSRMKSYWENQHKQRGE